MAIGICSVGLATAQGNVNDVLNGEVVFSPVYLPWSLKKWTKCKLCFQAYGIDPSLSGHERWNKLARFALADCIKEKPLIPGALLVAASCNGGADSFDAEKWKNAFNSRELLKGTLWESMELPVVSGSCTSGLHALFLAIKLLTAGLKEIIVLAVDILSIANHDNFENLRILSNDSKAPWQSNNKGFILGEAAVALRLSIENNPEMELCLNGPVLCRDHGGSEGLNNAIKYLSPAKSDLIIGQGAGPYEVDQVELNAFKQNIDMETPVTTALTHFGHTNGASGLLSVALAFLTLQSSKTLSSLSMFKTAAFDGRPLANMKKVNDHVVVGCRALGGACAAISIGKQSTAVSYNGNTWQKPLAPTPLSIGLLRHIAGSALQNKPDVPPGVLLVKLDSPLFPPVKAWIKERLLPSAILEITPGFIPNLIAGCWGFTGPSICLIGGSEASLINMIELLHKTGLTISVVRVNGHGESRNVYWEE